MATAGGPASIITQVQQGGAAPLATLGGEQLMGYTSTKQAMRTEC